MFRQIIENSVVNITSSTLKHASNLFNFNMEYIENLEKKSDLNLISLNTGFLKRMIFTFKNYLLDNPNSDI